MKIGLQTGKDLADLEITFQTTGMESVCYLFTRYVRFLRSRIIQDDRTVINAQVVLDLTSIAIIINYL